MQRRRILLEGSGHAQFVIDFVEVAAFKQPGERVVGVIRLQCQFIGRYQHMHRLFTANCRDLIGAIIDLHPGEVGRKNSIRVQNPVREGGQGIEMNRQALHNYLDAVNATLPRSDDAVAQIRDTIDEQFDQLEAQQQEALSMAEETVGDVEQSSDAYIEALDDQLGILIDAHERTEQRTVEALEQIETQVEQLQEEGQEQADELQERVQDLQDRLQPTVSED